MSYPICTKKGSCGRKTKDGLCVSAGVLFKSFLGEAQQCDYVSYEEHKESERA